MKYKLCKEKILIFLLYSISFGLIIFNNGIFWDGWVLYDQDPLVILNMFKQGGAFAYWIAYFHNILLSFKIGIFIERLLIFSSFIFSAFFLHSILKKVKEISNASRLFIVLFFTLFPVNFARISMITMMYTLCYFMFFLGFWLLSKYLENKLIFLRILSLIFLFFSFSTNSLLVFYIIPILYILYFEKDSFKNIRLLSKRVLKYFDFILMPVLFYIIKTLFFKSYSIYGGYYNTISLRSLFLSPINFIITFDKSFIYVINESFNFLYSNLFIILIISIILFIFLENIYTCYGENGKNDLRFLLFGIIAFLAGVFPYVAVGKIPSSFDLSSRHQLLVPLGASFIIYYGLKIFLNKLRLNFRIQIFIFSLIIVLFISSNFFSYLEYQKDWFKQLSLVENFKLSDIVKNNTTFLFKDNTLELNAKKRVYRFYEYGGLMKLAFGDEIRFGLNMNKIDYMEYFRELIEHPQYNSTDYQDKDPEYIVIIEYGNYQLSNKNTIELFYYKFFNKQKYREILKDIIILQYDKI